MKMDPYETLFGWSNRRLNGVWEQHDAFARHPLYPWPQDQDSKGDKPKASQSHLETQDHQKAQSTGEKSPQTEGEKIFEKSQSKNRSYVQLDTQSGLDSAKQWNKSSRSSDRGSDASTAASPFINAERPTISANVWWSRSGIDSAGKSFRESGELEFDPISMRMVPKKKPSNSTLDTQKDLEPRQSNLPQQQSTSTSTKTVGVSVPSKHHTSLEKSGSESKATETSKTQRSYDSFLFASDEATQEKAKSARDSLKRRTSQVSREEKLEKLKDWNRFKNAFADQIEWVKKSKAEHPSCARLANSLFKKLKPLKHMNAKELADHRQSLLNSWKQDLSKVEKAAQTMTRTDRKLEEEVSAQKTAMSAFENKWRYRERPSTPVESEKASQAPEKIAGEGDISTNVAEFAKNNRWYKDKAPHAATNEQRKHDHQLVRDVRQVYEDAYGPINITHRQGTCVSGTNKAADAAAEFNKLRDADDKHFARYINLNKISGTVSPKTEESPESSIKPEVSNQVRKASEHPERTKIHHITSNGPFSHYAALSHRPIGFTGIVTGPPVNWDQLKLAERLSLKEAMTKLSDPQGFVDRLIKDDRIGEDIVLAKDSQLVTRKQVPARSANKAQEPETATAAATDEDPSRASPTPTSSRSSKVNPIDGTTRNVPDLTPQPGNFASPTGFVNHDVFPTNGEQPKPKPSNHDSSCQTNTQRHDEVLKHKSPNHGRRVRKEEPVFSGRIPQQKLSIPEIVTLLNTKGLGIIGRDWSESDGRRPPPCRRFNEGKTSTGRQDASHGNGRNGGRYRQSREGRDFKNLGFARRFAKILWIGGLFALTAYATGVVIEYFREEPADLNASIPPEEHTESDAPAWMSSRRRKLEQARKAQVEKEEAEMEKARAEIFGRVFTGFVELHLLGLLAWAVWKVISASGGGA